MTLRKGPFIIVLDAGHGYGVAHNRGGVCYNEGDNNFYYSLVLKRELERLPGVIVKLTRNKITDNPSFDARGRVGEGADLLLSLHSDAWRIAAVNGASVFDSVRHPNRALASKLVNAISDIFNNNNRGVGFKEGRTGWDWYAILRNSKAKSSMIIEHGFHTNMKDCSFFKNNHTAIAKVTTSIIQDHYGLGGKMPDRGPSISVPGGQSYYSRKVNNRGPGVKLLQTNLNKVMSKKISTDGIFGPATEASVKAFQAKYKLSVDGLAGPKTLAKLASLTKPKPRPTTKPKATLAIDGLWGKGTTRALQKALGTPVDGIISGQYANDVTIQIFGTTHTHRNGSMMVKALQKKLGVRMDGYLGPVTIKALQRYLRTPVDGKLSRPSMVVKEMQRKLNRGLF